ncbi:MAG: DUF983 domain-containing protein [Roseiflexaceae bacterium]
MFRLLRALWDGLLLRCPRCHAGRMFERGFTVNKVCPNCDLLFEKATGEITGGMGVNTVATLAVITLVSLVLGLNPAVPLGPLLLGLALFAILFPIAFYRSSRGLWAGFLYITGDNDERD